MRLGRELCRVWTAAGNTRRRRLTLPAYIHFSLGGQYPWLRAAKRPLWQRWVVPRRRSLQDLEQQFNRMAEEPRLKGVILSLERLSLSFAQMQTLFERINLLQSAGKRVLIWAKQYQTVSYYLASAADEILLQPGGTVGPLGLVAEYRFLADALEQWGLKADMMAVSPYKAAGDMLARNGMSREARENAEWLMGGQYEEWVGRVAAGRKLDPRSVRSLVDRSPFTDGEAVEAGLIDRIVTEEELVHSLETIGRRVDTWHRTHSRLPRPLPARRQQAVGLVSIIGTIVDGYSQRPPVRPPFPVPVLLDEKAGDRTVIQALRRAERDKRIEAVVLFINSRGGSASASEAIASAVAKLAQTKPVTACMGSIAASGGYYVATPAQWIVAQPMTVTGSIGVLVGKLIDAGLLDRLQIRRELISRGANSTMYHSQQPFSESQRDRLAAALERTYDLFLERTATGRGLARKDVEAVAGGRVWTGRQACEHGLVDELGSVSRAAQVARSRASLPPEAPLLPIGGRAEGGYSTVGLAALLTYAQTSLQEFNTAGLHCMLPLDWNS